MPVVKQQSRIHSEFPDLNDDETGTVGRNREENIERKEMEKRKEVKRINFRDILSIDMSPGVFVFHREAG